jgi:hypothetical protein
LNFNPKYFKLRTSICGVKYIQVMHTCNYAVGVEVKQSLNYF